MHKIFYICFYFLEGGMASAVFARRLSVHDSAFAFPYQGKVGTT